MRDRGDIPASPFVSAKLSHGLRYALNTLLNSGVKPVAAITESACIGFHCAVMIFLF